MTLTLRYAARSDRGLLRRNNQDSVYAGPRLLAVADGMGGMAGGEVASNIVVGALAPLDEDTPGSDLVEALRQAILTAKSQLRDAVDGNPALEGMGTTLTAMLYAGSRIALAHVGDSRAYLLRDGQLSQVTRDDTYVQMLVDEGRISADEATTHPQRSLLTRVLDGRDFDPEFSVREVRAGDRYLLCSDGLSGVVSPETIHEALSLPQPGEAADRLVALALRGGGPDNITCIVADAVDLPIGDVAPVVGGAAAKDRAATTLIDAGSPAGRAALATPQAADGGRKHDGGDAVEVAGNPGDGHEDDNDPDGPDEPDGPPRRRGRIVLIGVVLIALLAGAGTLGWLWTQNQYYVGVSNSDRVAVFRGLEGEFAGLRLSKLDSETDLPLSDLNPVSRRQVQEGIQASTLASAQNIIDNIRLNGRLPECAPSTSSLSPSGSSVSQTPGGASGGTPGPSVPASGGVVPAGKSTPTTPTTQPTPGSPTPTSPSVSASPDSSVSPNTPCRTPK
jgi:protein phosphatase